MCRDFEKSMAMAQKNKNVDHYHNFIKALDQDAKPELSTKIETKTSTETSSNSRKPPTINSIPKQQEKKSSDDIIADKPTEQATDSNQTTETNQESSSEAPIEKVEIKQDGTVKIVHNYKETFECGLWAAQHSTCTVFHDTESFPEVRRAVIDIAKAAGKKVYNYPYHNGLGIIV